MAQQRGIVIDVRTQLSERLPPIMGRRASCAKR